MNLRCLMKSLLIIFSSFFTLIVNANESEFRRPTKFNCHYTNQKVKMNLDVHLLMGKSFVAWRSKSLANPVKADIFDENDTYRSLKVRGFLPAPWLESTTFEIELIKNSNFHTIKYIGPRGESIEHDMVCVQR
jgi:hypothetical protein